MRCFACLRSHLRRGKLEELVAEHLDNLYYLNDINSLGIEVLSTVLAERLLNALFLPLYVYSMTASNGMPDPVWRLSACGRARGCACCGPCRRARVCGSMRGVLARTAVVWLNRGADGRPSRPPMQAQRPQLQPVVALYLLAQVFIIFTHRPLLTALAAAVLRSSCDIDGWDVVDDTVSPSDSYFIGPAEHVPRLRSASVRAATDIVKPPSEQFFAPPTESLSPLSVTKSDERRPSAAQAAPPPSGAGSAAAAPPSPSAPASAHFTAAMTATAATVEAGSTAGVVLPRKSQAAAGLGTATAAAQFARTADARQGALDHLALSAGHATAAKTQSSSSTASEAGGLPITASVPTVQQAVQRDAAAAAPTPVSKPDARLEVGAASTALSTAPRFPADAPIALPPMETARAPASLFGYMRMDRDDWMCLPALCLTYAIIRSPGVHRHLLEAADLCSSVSRHAKMVLDELTSVGSNTASFVSAEADPSTAGIAPLQEPSNNPTVESGTLASAEVPKEPLRPPQSGVEGLSATGTSTAMRLVRGVRGSVCRVSRAAHDVVAAGVASLCAP